MLTELKFDNNSSRFQHLTLNDLNQLTQLEKFTNDLNQLTKLKKLTLLNFDSEI
jgi:hypothetical protein